MSDNISYQRDLINIFQIKYSLIPRYFFEKLKNFQLSLEERFVFLEIWYLYFDEKVTVTENVLVDKLNIDEDKVLGILANLITQGLIEFKEEDGILSYDAMPFISLLLEEYGDGEEENKDEALLYKVFEDEFKRPLSPAEVGYIDEWLNEKYYGKDMIIEVLKLTVAIDKLNIKYIDRVLQDWFKKGISTRTEYEKIAIENKGKKKKTTSKAKKNTKPGKYDDLYE